MQVLRLGVQPCIRLQAFQLLLDASLGHIT
jgi:hypothetical protein